MARLGGATVLLVSMALSVMPAFAASPSRDLEGIKKKIQSERRSLSQVEKKEGAMADSLIKVESDLEKKKAQLKNSSARLQSVLSEMEQKESELLQVRQTLGQHRSYFARRAGALYRWHRGVSPFVIFNGDVSPALLQKRRYYLQTTMAFDRATVRTLDEQRQREELLVEQLSRKKEAVDGQRRALAEARESVEKEAQTKRQLLASLRQERESRLRALKELEQAAARLQKMVEEIARRSAGKPSQTPAGAGLAAMRGKLEWPVQGQIIGAFGKAKHREFSTEVFRNGLEFQAPLGEEIRAVEQGRVVFADRFAGYGNMLIIDHGDRYYTVYAHLADFLKKTGEAVRRGEPVARVGDSDSLAGAKLYFEMRKDGRSIDPQPWFKKR